MPSDFWVTTFVESGSGDAKDLTGVGDELIVTSTGTLMGVSNGDHGVFASGADEAVTIDGAAYSFFAAAVKITGDNTELDVNGTVQGNGTGVNLGAAGDVANIGVTGVVTALSDGSGATAYGFHINDDGTAGDSGGAIVNNAGDIFGATSGIFCDTTTGGNTITNSGTISGSDGIDYTSEASLDFLTNTGTITGADFAINSSASAGGNDIANSGVISSDYTAMVFSDKAGTFDRIQNSGEIIGTAYAIVSGGSSTIEVSNSGTIDGGLSTDSTSVVTIDNSGVWQTGAKNGTEYPLISLSDTGNTMNNSGKIHATIDINAGGNNVINSGTILGAIDFTGAGTGADHVTNSGDLTGSVTFGKGADTLVNSGAITGSITFAGAKGGFQNHGQIYGSVTAGVSYNVTNTGTIHGNISLGDSDTVYASRGVVTGSITCGAKDDVFVFTDSFGHETIDKFLGRTSSSHDTLEFSTNDFASFTAVQSAMKEEGGNVVIKLDSTDTIVLAGLTSVSSLVSSDFKFIA